MMAMNKVVLRVAGWVLLGMPGVSLGAGIGLNKTRVIFSSGERMESLGVNNSTESAWLVQVRVLGEQEQEETTMVATPPLFRLEPHSRNSLRILSTDQGRGFSTDRESLRYVQVTAIPASTSPPSSNEASQMAVAVSMRIKLFWRPAGLPTPGKAVYQQVAYTTSSAGLQACNATRYYLSFNRLSIDGRDVDLNRMPSMLPPLGCVRYPEIKTAKHIRWSMINDYGGDSGWFDSLVGTKT